MREKSYGNWRQNERLFGEWGILDEIGKTGLEERLNVPGVEVDMWMDGKVMRSGFLGIR